MNKELYNKISNAKSIDGLMTISHESGEDLTKEEATIIFEKIQKHELSDNNLSNIIGGYLFNVGGDQKYFKGDIVDAYVNTHDLSGYGKKRCEVIDAYLDGVIWGTWVYKLSYIIGNNTITDEVNDTSIDKKY